MYRIHVIGIQLYLYVFGIQLYAALWRRRRPRAEQRLGGWGQGSWLVRSLIPSSAHRRNRRVTPSHRFSMHTRNGSFSQLRGLQLSSSLDVLYVRTAVDIFSFFVFEHFFHFFCVS
jgi:hypothetical protein